MTKDGHWGGRRVGIGGQLLGGRIVGVVRFPSRLAAWDLLGSILLAAHTNAGKVEHHRLQGQPALLICPAQRACRSLVFSEEERRGPCRQLS